MKRNGYLRLIRQSRGHAPVFVLPLLCAALTLHAFRTFRRRPAREPLPFFEQVYRLRMVRRLVGGRREVEQVWSLLSINIDIIIGTYTRHFRDTIELHMYIYVRG